MALCIFSDQQRRQLPPQVLACRSNFSGTNERKNRQAPKPQSPLTLIGRCRGYDKISSTALPPTREKWGIRIIPGASLGNPHESPRIPYCSVRRESLLLGICRDPLASLSSMLRSLFGSHRDPRDPLLEMIGSLGIPRESFLEMMGSLGIPKLTSLLIGHYGNL